MTTLFGRYRLDCVQSIAHIWLTDRFVWSFSFWATMRKGLPIGERCMKIIMESIHFFVWQIFLIIYIHFFFSFLLFAIRFWEIVWRWFHSYTKEFRAWSVQCMTHPFKWSYKRYENMEQFLRLRIRYESNFLF